MGQFDTQQVCLNGHQITANYYRTPEFRKDHCDECGEKTIYQCPNCGKEIRGEYHVERVFAVMTVSVPSHCDKCGKPFPWTVAQSALAEATQGTGTNDSCIIIEQIFSRFHLAVKQLRQRHDKRITLDVGDEYDVQDLLHVLLVLFFDDVRIEEWTPSYAGKCARMDFLLMGESIVIETKMTRPRLGAKEIGTELIEDIARYVKHPSCKKMYCFIYDPQGQISNPRGLEKDLSRDDFELKVKVMVVPKGY